VTGSAAAQASIIASAASASQNLPGAVPQTVSVSSSNHKTTRTDQYYIEPTSTGISGTIDNFSHTGSSCSGSNRIGSCLNALGIRDLLYCYENEE
jgi:hypothetical protein